MVNSQPDVEADGSFDGAFAEPFAGPVVGALCGSVEGAACAFGSAFCSTSLVTAALGAGAALVLDDVVEVGGDDQPPLNRFQPSCGAGLACCDAVEFCGALAGASCATATPAGISRAIAKPSAEPRR